MEGKLKWFGNVCRVHEMKVLGKSKRGIPRKTWNDGINVEADKRDISWEGIREITMDRGEWRKIYKKSKFNSTRLTCHGRKETD